MALSREDYEFLCQVLRDDTGIQLDTEKEYFFEARLKPLAKDYANSDLAHLTELLRSNQVVGLRQLVVEALAIHETYFFRDPLIYQALRESVFPSLIAARQAEKKLRIWCPACSSGEDPYSVGMMISEEFPQLLEWDIHFIASDFSRPILTRAMEGRYSMSQINRGLSARHLMTYFEQHGLAWGVKDSLRRMVDFREINLIKEWPVLPEFDLVLLRNVMIYFDDATRQQILDRIRRQMTPDGYLVLGATESIGNFKGFRTAFPGPHRPCYQQAGAEVRL